MIPGFRTFGGGAQDDFVDMTDPNVRSRMPDSRQAQATMRNNWMSSTRGEVAIRNVRRAAQQPLRKAVVKGQMDAEQMAAKLKEQKILDAAKAGRRQEQKAAIGRFAARRKQDLRRFGGQVRDARGQVAYNVGQVVGISEQQRVDFSREQMAMQQMFGGGDKIWGLGEDSGTQVRIHNDLNPRQRGDEGTARLFGF